MQKQDPEIDCHNDDEDEAGCLDVSLTEWGEPDDPDNMYEDGLL